MRTKIERTPCGRFNLTFKINKHIIRHFMTDIRQCKKSNFASTKMQSIWIKKPDWPHITVAACSTVPISHLFGQVIRLNVFLLCIIIYDYRQIVDMIRLVIFATVICLTLSSRISHVSYIIIILLKYSF